MLDPVRECWRLPNHARLVARRNKHYFREVSTPYFHLTDMYCMGNLNFSLRSNTKYLPCKELDINVDVKLCFVILYLVAETVLFEYTRDLPLFVVLLLCWW
jgi:hypothetical protein